MRAPRRHVASESPVRIPRASLDTEHHPRVDRLLKEIKLCSRRFSNSLTMYMDEYCVLERLYYKGKNQHRSALFWRSVVEMRKYCRRLHDMDMSAQINAFRSCFWGENANQKSKLTKGAWAHTPDTKSTLRFVDRLRDCTLLLEKSQIVFQKGYKAFALAIQSGSFAQLVLTLLSIISRLSFLASELRDTCQLLHTTIASSLLVQESDPILRSLSETTRHDTVTVGKIVTGSTHIQVKKASTMPIAQAHRNEAIASLPLPRVPIGKVHKEHKQRPKRSKLDEIDAIFSS